MNYKIIQDEEALRAFVNWLPDLQESEIYYLCLFARSKYCKEIVHIKSDKAQLKRFTSKKEDIIRKIRQLECPIGSYMQRDVVIPQEALALYITVNPRNLWKATTNSLVHLAKCIQTQARTVNPHQEVMSEIQRTKSRTCYVDFDIDSVAYSPEDIKGYYLDGIINKDATTLIQTRGGHHLLVAPDKVAEKYRKSWYNSIKMIPYVDQTGDCMIPVVGCSQGGFIPKFV